MNFEYKATVIVADCGAGENAAHSMELLDRQTTDKKDTEIIFVGDGSFGNFNARLLHCDEKNYSAFNVGIKIARGKYIFFLENGDEFSAETVEKVCEFFDGKYDETDMILFGKIQGVFALDSSFDFEINGLNFCIKNRGENNILFADFFDRKLAVRKYINDTVRDKMEIGFCESGKYICGEGKENRSENMYSHAYYSFENLMKYYEDLFAPFDENVPLFYQNSFLKDIDSRLNEDILFPYHYDGEKFDLAVGRIGGLLAKVETKTILECSDIDIYRACYWIKQKPNAEVEVRQSKGKIELVIDGKTVYTQGDFNVVGHKPRVEGDTFRLTAFVKTPVFSFLESGKDYEIFAVENGEEKKLETFVSVHSNYNAKTVTNIFPAFHYECDLNSVKKISFSIRLKGVKFGTHFSFTPYSGFRRRFRKIVRGGYAIKNENAFLSIKKSSQLGTDFLDAYNTVSFASHPRVAMLRLKSIPFRKKHKKIWLYYDFYTVEKDNGYFQFANDLKHDDGVERYYVLTHKYENLDDVFTPEQKKHLVSFGSEQHKLLFICADRIFTAYYGLSPVNPFNTAKMKYQYEDLCRYRTVYLQHGVLHASLRLNNSEERSQAEEIVVSSPFEVKNYTENYAYSEKELIQTGMARYDYIDKSVKPKNRILFAPSWRKYLTVEVKASNWKANTEKIMQSDYYKNFMAFLSDEKLHKTLEENGIYLDLKLHPIIADLTGVFEVDCDYINIVRCNVDVADYNAFVTDFSSYVFDFAYLERPIMYFVPDYPQFKAGMNHYRALDLPFEDAFGEMFTEPEKAAEALCRIIENRFVPDEKFAERMSEFYFDFNGNCAENLYRFVTEQDRKFKRN